jgi:hypothetical protein
MKKAWPFPDQACVKNMELQSQPERILMSSSISLYDFGKPSWLGPSDAAHHLGGGALKCYATVDAVSGMAFSTPTDYFTKITQGEKSPSKQNFSYPCIPKATASLVLTNITTPGGSKDVFSSFPASQAQLWVKHIAAQTRVHATSLSSHASITSCPHAYDCDTAFAGRLSPAGPYELPRQRHSLQTGRLVAKGLPAPSDGRGHFLPVWIHDW